MSPREELQGRVAVLCAAVSFGLLVLAGVLLAVLRWGLGMDVEKAWQSYRGWMCMVPLTALAIFLGRTATIIFFTSIALLGFREFARATVLHGDRYLTSGVYLGILAAGTAVLVPDPSQLVPGWYDLFMAMPVFVIAGILTIPILRNRVQGQLQAVTLASFAFIYFGWMCGHVAFLANAKHAYAYLIYLLFAVELGDVA